MPEALRMAQEGDFWEPGRVPDSESARRFYFTTTFSFSLIPPPVT